MVRAINTPGNHKGSAATLRWQASSPEPPETLAVCGDCWKNTRHPMVPTSHTPDRGHCPGNPISSISISQPGIIYQS